MPLIATDQLGNPYSIVIDSTDGSMVVTPVQNLAPSTADNSISTTAISLISSTLRLICVLESGEVPDISEANDSLVTMNQMLDSWNADGLAIYTTSASDYALIPGKQTYTLGPGGDFNTNRPAQIDSMSAILLNNPLNPIEVPITMYSVKEWQSKLAVKTVSGSFPLICYDTGDFPLRELNMWPIPTQANNIRLYAWQPLGLAATLQSSMAFPPGYAEAFRYNLARRLAPEFSRPVPPDVMATAIESLARIKTMNAPELKLKSDLVAGSTGYSYKAEMFGLPY